jgi:hypothetical protein
MQACLEYTLQQPRALSRLGTIDMVVFVNVCQCKHTVHACDVAWYMHAYCVTCR